MMIRPRQAVAMFLEDHGGWHDTWEIQRGLERRGIHMKVKQVDSVLTNGMSGGGPKGLVASGYAERRRAGTLEDGWYEYRRTPVEGGLL